MVEQRPDDQTALAPEIGYDAAAAIAKEAYASGRTIREVAREKTSLSDADLDRILDPSGMTEPGLTSAPGRRLTHRRRRMSIPVILSKRSDAKDLPDCPNGPGDRFASLG